MNQLPLILKNTNKKMRKDFLNFFKPDVTSSRDYLAECFYEDG